MELFQTVYPFVEWSIFVPFALLFVRVLLAVMFIDSGRLHLMDPKGRGEGLGLSPTLIILTGLGNVASGTLILFGFLTHIGALIMIGIMLGAIYFKMLVWHTGLYGEQNNGWYYDALLMAVAGILLVYGAGAISIDALIFAL